MLQDCYIIRWDVDSGSKTVYEGGPTVDAKQGHGNQVLCIALSSDGTFLASGGRDSLVRVWDTRQNKVIDTLKGHRGVVTCLGNAFVFNHDHSLIVDCAAWQRGTHRLFSGSTDRTVKVWDADQMAYVETLFGHSADIRD